MDDVNILNRCKESEHLCVFRYGDHYEWNKVVTCIHNVLSQQRYLEHYGEVTISNLNNSVCTCKITFVKVREVFESSFCDSFFIHILKRTITIYSVDHSNPSLCSSVSLAIGAQMQIKMRFKAKYLTRVVM